MQTFCGWKGCDASYMGDAIMPPGWVNFLAVGIKHSLPASLTLCPEHARALQGQLKNAAQEIDQMSPASSEKPSIETVRPAVAVEHQPSCFGLEEERGGNWTGSGVPAIKEARPSL